MGTPGVQVPSPLVVRTNATKRDGYGIHKRGPSKSSDNWIEAEARVPVGGGFCEAYEPVYKAFLKNFRDNELGATVAVVRHGEIVVDLWGGYQDLRKSKPWTADTMVCFMSVAKVFSVLTIHMLADRGLLDLAAPVAKYWPEFAAHGKGEITLSSVLNHTAGVPIVEGLPRGSVFNWKAMTKGLAAQKPLWPPGSVHCYHTATQGFILGEVLRRITGMSVGAFLRKFVSDPLGLDYYIGLRPGEAKRCAQMIPAVGTALTLSESDEYAGMLVRGWAQLPVDEDFNSAAWRRAEVPSVNGHGTARSVARFFGALAQGGEIDGVRIIGHEALRNATAEEWHGRDRMSGLTFRAAKGFFLNCSPDRPMGPHRETFGHSGAGGAQGFSDPVYGLGFAYGPNRMHGGIDNGSRGTRLINALFRSAVNDPLLR